MKASEKQIKTFDKAFDREWRKLFVHLMERKNIIITILLRKHELKSVTQTETEFFEDLGRDGLFYWLKSYYEENKTEFMKRDDEADSAIKQLLKDIKRIE